MILAGLWSVVGGAHIQEFTCSCKQRTCPSIRLPQRRHTQDHGPLPDKHISKHSGNVLDSLVRTAKNRKELWTRPPVLCEGGGDVVGVVTPLVGGVAQAFHDDQVVELRVQLGVQEVEGKEEKEGQVELEEEKRLKEVRSWMTMEMCMTRLRS